jgi:tetratricopeptide (TPR) repeat protein
MGPGTGPFRRFVIALVGVLLAAASTLATDPQAVDQQAVDSQAVDPQVAERFRAAAVLQERALFDLAADEYAAIARDFAADPLAERARLQRGICLFQLQDYAAAAAELGPLATREHRWSPAEAEQALAYLGLAKYNLARAATSPERERLLDEAIAALAKQLAEFPDGSLARQSAFYHAESLYARGRLDDAVAAYRSLLTKFPQHPQRADALYALAVADHERKHYADAIEAFACFEREYVEHAACADARARHADALLSLAESQLSAGDPSAARRTAEKLLAEFRESALVPPALLLNAQVQFAHEEFEPAEKSLDECIARSTHSAVTNNARLLRASVRYERANFAGSRVDALAVLAGDPNSFTALHLCGRCDARLNHPTEAIKSFSELLTRFPDYAHRDQVLYDLAWAQQEAGQLEAATATFAKLAESCPTSEFAPECRFRRGESRYAAQDYAGAASHYAAALASATQPDLRDRSLHKLAWCSFERGQFAAAEAAFERKLAAHQQRVVPFDPLTADALLMIAECRFQQQRFDLALQSFDVAAKQSAGSELLRAMVTLHAAQCAAELNQWERTRELADRTIHDFSTSTYAREARYERGDALRELGRLDEAEQDLAAVAAAKPGVLQLKAELAIGKIQAARNDHDAAVRTFFKVAYGHGGQAAPASYHPWQAEAIFAAAAALEKSGRSDAAEKLYRELVDVYPSSTRTTAARESLDRILRR